MTVLRGFLTPPLQAQQPTVELGTNFDFWGRERSKGKAKNRAMREFTGA